MRRFSFLLLFLSSSLSSFAFEAALQINVGKGKIAGTLTAPDTAYKKTVFLLIAGSGPTDRDGNSSILPGKNNSLKYLAEDLTAKGFAAFRYDKPGIAASAQWWNPETLKFSDMVLAAAEVVRHLKTELGFEKVVIIGHSEGALIGLLASQKNVDGYVSLAGPGQNAAALLKQQLSQLDASTKEKAFAKLDSLKAGFPVANDIQSLQSIFYSQVQPYLMEWFQHDPCEIIKNLTIPSLIIQGTEDLQVPVSEGELLKNCAPHATYLELLYMNHVLKVVEEGDPSDNQKAYSDPSLPLHPGLIPSILKKFQ